ncbi:EthD domain-containing protein [Aspergillus coremiiformis]|uniref:EthD domain-containing protein n=1 Tax=Aspergillus coremiiformis TaxID=138285 RepID=A0A5N6YUQ5_9EURO|nr:EthD domain-containing protein [Aspergillus coremiiformis]
MVYKILLYITRKPGTTPAEFKSHYETVHMPLVRRIAGADFPLSHRRLYLARPAPGADNSFPAAALVGSPEEFFYDAIAEVTFADEAAFKVFFGRREEPGVRELVEGDEEAFLDRTRFRAVVLGDVEESVG